MKLNIYGKIDGKKVVVKTYESDTYDLMWGTIEDVADAINLDSMKTGSNDEILKMAGNLVLKSRETVNDLLKDCFEGLTDEELRNCKVSEMAVVFVEIVRFTMAQLGKGAKSKN